MTVHSSLGVLLLPAALAQLDSCAFDHNKPEKPCCGQEGAGVVPTDPHVCPAEFPICTLYRYNHHYGWCANAASGTAFCDDCNGEFSAAHDVGGYDIDPCGAGGCPCGSDNDHCIGPVTEGSEEHKAACCALCSIYPDCKQWVVSLDHPPRCWLKGELGTKVPSPTRGIGTVAPAYIAHGCMPHDDIAAWTFLGLVVVGVAMYLVGGVMFGRAAMKRGGSNAGAQLLMAHPHYMRWTELRGLCVDGLRFARGRCRGSAKKARLEQGLTKREEGAPTQQAKKKSKKERNKAKRSHSSSSRNLDNEGQEATVQLCSPATANTGGGPVDAGVKSTVSGAGGRWVHIAS